MVEDGAAALTAARETAFDALILDWNMPDLDGIDVCRQFMADPAVDRRCPSRSSPPSSHDGAKRKR